MAPRQIAILVSFAFCGFFFHDLLLLPFTGMPLITVWFVFLGGGVLIGEALHMTTAALPRSVRVAVNVAYLVGLFELARRATLSMFAGYPGVRGGGPAGSQSAAEEPWK